MFEVLKILPEGYATPLSIPLNVFGSVGSARYAIRDIQGLGPPNADIMHVRHALGVGSEYQSTVISSRNIVLTIAPKDNHQGSIQANLNVLYNYTKPGSKVRLTFDELYIEGYVESHDINNFSENPEVQISILCLYPYFMGNNEEHIVLEGTNTSVYPLGDVPTPFKATFDNDNQPIHNFKLEIGFSGSSSNYLELYRSISPGWRLNIDTEPGSKDVFIDKPDGSEKHSVISSINYKSVWLMLNTPGVANHFRYTPAGSNSELVITYRPRYLTLLTPTT